jgi:DNA-binding transcriptional LysR family regulator
LESLSETKFAAACGAADALVRERGLRHLGDPILAKSLAAAARRDVGDGSWVMTRKGSAGDITAAVSLAVATHALSLMPDYAVDASIY